MSDCSAIVVRLACATPFPPCKPTLKIGAMTLSDRLVWITGASSGIGEALAYTLSQRGAHLVLSSRREDVLDDVRQRCARSDRHVVQPLDLTDPDSLQDAAETVQQEIGPVDILINNGGISQRGTAADTDMSVVRRIMEVNFFGAVELTKAVLPSMQKRGRGHIAVVSSVLGKFATPMRSTYVASKHALQGWYESLRAEVHEDGIGVTIVSPGYVQTNVQSNALNAAGSPLGPDAQQKGIPASDCATAIADALEHNRAEVHPGGWETLAVYIKRFFPSLFRRFMRQYEISGSEK